MLLYICQVLIEALLLPTVNSMLIKLCVAWVKEIFVVY